MYSTAPEQGPLIYSGLQTDEPSRRCRLAATVRDREFDGQQVANGIRILEPFETPNHGTARVRRHSGGLVPVPSKSGGEGPDNCRVGARQSGRRHSTRAQLANYSFPDIWTRTRLIGRAILKCQARGFDFSLWQRTQYWLRKACVEAPGRPGRQSGWDNYDNRSAREATELNCRRA
jgi:hypothetical protein